LLDWLGLEQVNTIEPKPGIPPSPGHVAALLGQMRQRGVEVVVQEEFFPTTAGKLLAEKTGARLVVLPGGPDFDGNQSYLSYIRTSADRLFEGFKR
jgi:zinc/manganese transport system substrate-binding protein